MLNGFHVEPCAKGGALIIATDGRVMAVFRDESGKVKQSGTVTLTHDALRACFVPGRLLMVRGTTATVFDLVGRKRVRVAEQINVVADGFPESWRKALPGLPSDAKPVFNPVLIGKFRKVAGPGAGLRILPTSEHDAAWVLATRKDFVGAIMPMRADMDFPDWFTPRKARRRSAVRAAAKAA